MIPGAYLRAGYYYAVTVWASRKMRNDLRHGRLKNDRNIYHAAGAADNKGERRYDLERDADADGWSCHNISDIYPDIDFFTADRSDSGIRRYQQMETAALSDSGAGMDYPGYTADASAYHYFLRAGAVAGPQYLERK